MKFEKKITKKREKKIVHLMKQWALQSVIYFVHTQTLFQSFPNLLSQNCKQKSMTFDCWNLSSLPHTIIVKTGQKHRYRI